MRRFLKCKNTLSFYRFKSKSSSGKYDKHALERLEYENKLLFGEPLKNGRRKSRKTAQLILEDDPSDECTYHEVPKNEPASVDMLIKDQNIDKNVTQPFEKVESPQLPGITIQVKEPEEGISVNEPVPLFPLFNETKKEYVPSQIYYINPMRKKNSQTFPTVTTILTETMTERSKSLLSRWKDKQAEELGKDKFEEQQKKQLQSRNILLKLIQKRLLGVQTEDLDVLPEFEGCWQSLECVFPLFSKVIAMEKMVIHPELQYKGMIDSIVEFKNKPVLVSWKKSNKFKSSIDMTYDAPIQISAYIGALNYDKSYPFKIEESLLVMSYEDGSKGDIFHLKTENCLYYWKSWLQRLYLYQSRQNEVKSKGQEPEKIDTSESSNEASAKPQPKGFNSSAYTNFTEVQTTPKRIKKTAELQVSFPIYNDLKNDYISEHLYEINPVKQTAHSCYPSVTTILGETKSESSKFVLKRWKDNLIAEMGIDGFETYQKNLLQSGTMLHSLIQQRLLGTAEKDLDIIPELVGCWKSLENVFPLFSDIKITESNVVHKELKYKGVIDCIAEFKGKPMIIDWKKSDKIKATIDMTYDAPLQIAAYIGATNYDDFYPFKIEEGLLIMSYIDGTKADIFYLNRESCQRYWNQWLERLHKYQTMIKANDLKIDY